jgi:hypothetical protein
VGFNAMQPGKIKKSDLIMLGCAIAAVAAALFWVIR